MDPAAPIGVVGTGYVGLVSAVCFAHLGHHLVCMDVDAAKIARLQRGDVPIYEPGLDKLIDDNASRLSFTTSYDELLDACHILFIAVDTPPSPSGDADLSRVQHATTEIARRGGRRLLVMKSTVPVGTGEKVVADLEALGATGITYASNPEFLREGAAIQDFLEPDRIVIGASRKEDGDLVEALYRGIDTDIVRTSVPTAEMVKYASNAFLATKISFINEIANVCEALGADIKEVATGMGYDPRIGRAFLEAGLGYGGSCFPKDVKALAYMAAEKGRHPQLLQAVMDINADSRRRIVERVQDLLGGLRGKTIGLLGLTFKPNTDDLREAPALEIARRLQADGAAVRAYDPVGMPRAEGLLPGVHMAADAYDLADGCDAVIVCTEWNEFKNLDLKRLHDRMRQPVIVDGRNIYDPNEMAAFGFHYRGVGRGYDRTPKKAKT